MEHKKFEELELRDDFIFGKVMRNKSLCKKMLETLLDIEIDDIHFPDTQKVIDITYQGKSVRLDIYVERSLWHGILLLYLSEPVYGRQEACFK